MKIFGSEIVDALGLTNIQKLTLHFDFDKGCIPIVRVTRLVLSDDLTKLKQVIERYELHPKATNDLSSITCDGK
jgi:hypothetical protein